MNNKPFIWSKERIEFLKKHYPENGKMWCAEKLGAKEHSIRYKAAELKLRLNKNSEFYKNVIKKRAKAVTGRKRPEQASVMKELWEKGKIVSPPKKEFKCTVCGKGFFREDSKNHRKTCSDKCFLYYTKNQWKIIKHPKGMTGKTHSEELKKRLSKRSKKMWADPNSKINSKEAGEKRSKTMSLLHQKGILGGENSYSRCKRGWFDNGSKKYFMRSKWEMNYACYLDFLLKYKHINDWEYEVDTFWFENIKRGVRSYKPDFKIYNNDKSIEYHEVKGWMDDKSKTKLKRMAKYYPEIKLIVIGQDEYKTLAKQKVLFKGWE